MTNFGPIGGLVAAVQILLADDNERMLKAVERLSQGFELADDIVFVGEVADGQALVERALLLNPDIIITDINMPILDGIRAAARLKEAGCPSKIIFLTVHADPEIASECLRKGALGFVEKGHMATDLVLAIKAAIAGRPFISPSILPQN